LASLSRHPSVKDEEESTKRQHQHRSPAGEPNVSQMLLVAS
jgi:hypothetical protein